MRHFDKKALFHTVMIYLVSAAAGLLFNYYKGDGHTSVLGVLGFAIGPTVAAVLVAAVVVRLIGRR